MDETYQAEEDKQRETSEENSAAHTTELLQAAAPFFDKRTQQSLHLITQITDLLSTAHNIGRSNISALSLSFHNVDIEGLLHAIRPHCTMNEASIVDRVLSIFGIKRVYDTYQNFSSMPFNNGAGSSTFNPDMIMNIAKAFGGGDGSASPFGNMNPEVLQNLFRYMNNGNMPNNSQNPSQNPSQNTTQNATQNANPNTAQTGPMAGGDNNTASQNSHYTNYYNSPNKANNAATSVNNNSGYPGTNQNPFAQNPAYHTGNNPYYNPAPNYGYHGTYPSGDYNGYPYYNANPGNDYINPETWKNYDASNYSVNAASLPFSNVPGSTAQTPLEDSFLPEEPSDLEENNHFLEENSDISEETDLYEEASPLEAETELDSEESAPLTEDIKEETPSYAFSQTNRNRYMLNSPFNEEDSDGPEVRAASFPNAPNPRHPADARRRNSFSNPFMRRNNVTSSSVNQAQRKATPPYSPSGKGIPNQAKDNARKSPSPELVNMLTSMLSPEQKETFDSMRKLFDTNSASGKPNP